MKKLVFLGLGGPEDSMEKRIQALLEKYNSEKDDAKCQWVVTGLLKEISFMKKRLNEHGVDEITTVYSRETVENLENTAIHWEKADVVYFSTSTSHANRVRFIVGEKYEKFNFIHSGELDVRYALFAEQLYRYSLTRFILHKIGCLIRKWIPLIKKPGSRRAF